jgi:hypothetical protein
MNNYRQIFNFMVITEPILQRYISCRSAIVNELEQPSLALSQASKSKFCNVFFKYMEQLAKMKIKKNVSQLFSILFLKNVEQELIQLQFANYICDL